MLKHLNTINEIWYKAVIISALFQGGGISIMRIVSQLSQWLPHLYYPESQVWTTGESIYSDLFFSVTQSSFWWNVQQYFKSRYPHSAKTSL